MYFSEREAGLKPRVSQRISEQCWKGIVYAIQSRMSKGNFAEAFPRRCHKDGWIIGTDFEDFEGATAAHNLPWPAPEYNVPNEPEIMDLLEFCYRHVAFAEKFDGCQFHPFHLRFDGNGDGPLEFLEGINTIFSRHGMAFEMRNDGKVHRIPYPMVAEEITAAVFNTGDSTLNELLHDAREKFLDPDATQRPLAIEKLWDAWERLKSLEDPNKRRSVEILLNRTTQSQPFMEALNADAQALTDLGNRFQIRHFETGKVAIEGPLHYDYLFHRLFSLMALLMRSSGRM